MCGCSIKSSLLRELPGLATGNLSQGYVRTACQHDRQRLSLGQAQYAPWRERIYFITDFKACQAFFLKFPCSFKYICILFHLSYQIGTVVFSVNWFSIPLFLSIDFPLQFNTLSAPLMRLIYPLMQLILKKHYHLPGIFELVRINVQFVQITSGRNLSKIYVDF